MKVQNISGRQLVITIDTVGVRLEDGDIATFPDTLLAQEQYVSFAQQGFVRKVGLGIAYGAQAATTAIAADDTQFALRSGYGTGRIPAGSVIRIGDDPTDYTVTVGTNDVALGDTLTVTPAIVEAQAAASFPTIAVSDPAVLPFGAEDQQLCILTFGTSHPADAGTLTINGVVFEFDTNAAPVEGSTYTTGRIVIPTHGLTAAADIAAIAKTTINANATLDELEIKVTSLLTISTTTYAALVCPVDTTLVVSESATNLAISTEAPVYRNSRRMQMFTHTLTGTTDQIYTGFTKIESVIAQVRSSAGTVLLYNGAITTSGGWISLAAAPAGTIAGYDPVRVLANTDVVTLLVTGW